MDVDIRGICDSVVNYCQSSGEGKVQKANFEPNIPTFIKVMEAIFKPGDDQAKINAFFKIGEQTQKATYDDVYPLLVKRCAEIKDELATKLIKETLEKAAKTLEGNYRVVSDKKIVLHMTPTLSGGGGWEDYGQFFQPYYLETISSVDQAYKIMAATTIFQYREMAKSIN